MPVKTPCFLALLLIMTASAWAQGPMKPFLVKDINPGPARSLPYYLVNMNGILYFNADDGAHGEELWRSDGTAAGTWMVKDICPGATGSWVRYPIVMNGILYFTASDGATGLELWRSDGSAAGTFMVKDIFPGSSGSHPLNFAIMNGRLFFGFDSTGPSQGQFWVSDGTANGTVMIRNIGKSPGYVANCGGMLYFAGHNASYGWELWRSDGSSAGTYMIKDLAPGAADAFPRYFTMLGGKVYFLANDCELWKTDGTAAGTTMIFRRDSPFLIDLVNVNGTLFFATGGYENPRELYKSDGTANGTERIKYIGDNYTIIHQLMAFNGMACFGVWNGAGLNGLWRSDGTDAGTIQVKSIDFRYNYFGPMDMVAHDDALFFVANEPEHGMEIWKSDGTAAGTMLAADVAPGPPSSIPRYPTLCGARLFFAADGGAGHGEELWALDLTPTTPVALSAFTAD